MPARYVVDLSIDNCIARLKEQEKAVNLDNGYSLSIIVNPVSIGIGTYRVKITRNIRGWRRGRKSAIYVLLKKTGGTITEVRIQNTEQFTPMILGTILVGFGIIMGLRGFYFIAGVCLVVGTIVLGILWMLYTGRLVPRDLVKLVQQTLPDRS